MPSLPGQKRCTMPTPGTLETSSGQAQAPTPHRDRRKRLSHLCLTQFVALQRLTDFHLSGAELMTQNTTKETNHA